ncbi:hypothetical protein [Meiothermus cerbereus]|uniref:hypothetical protein n=1 Tax=Meiothermus cerbereus TaxID=65552 RepID=UPI003EECA31C
MARTDAARIEPKPFLRFVAGLLNRCPSWVASLTPDQGYALARSPVGARYLFQVLTHPSALEDVLAAQKTHRADGVVLVLLDEPSSPSFAALAKAHGVQLWTLSQVDYLVMAADLESNAPLAYLGLEVYPPKSTVAPPPTPASQATQGF